MALNVFICSRAKFKKFSTLFYLVDCVKYLIIRFEPTLCDKLFPSRKSSFQLIEKRSHVSTVETISRIQPFFIFELIMRNSRKIYWRLETAKVLYWISRLTTAINFSNPCTVSFLYYKLCSFFARNLTVAFLWRILLQTEALDRPVRQSTVLPFSTENFGLPIFEIEFHVQYIFFSTF